MSVFEIYKTDEKIYDIYTSNYERALLFEELIRFLE